MPKMKIEEIEESMSTSKRFGVVVFVLSLLLCLFAGAAGYFYYQYKKATPSADTKEEISRLVGKIGTVMELPEGETPTLATVTDKDKLTNQPFFRKSENGDKVLIYTDAGRAILYRPSIGKIVDITSINIQDDPMARTEAPTEEKEVVSEESAPAAEVTVSGPAKVAFLNGSTKVGVTQAAEEKLLSAFPEGVSVVGKEKASKSTYQGIIVADISGRVSTQVGEIATVLGGTVGTFPVEELIPGQADIVVIIGNVVSDTTTDTGSKTETSVARDSIETPKGGAAIQQ